MENARFLKIVIVVLLVLNVSVMAYMWMNRPTGGPHQGPPPPRQDVFAYLCNELKLDEQQTRQYEELRDEHHQAIENAQKHGRQLRERFFDMLHATPVDSALVKKMTDSIAATQQQIEMATFYHFQKVRAILHPDQQKHFAEIIQNALRMMAPQGPPPPPR